MTKKPEIEVRVPSWLESHRALQHGKATPLQRFVALNEPASGELREHFRASLAEALAEVVSRRRRASAPGGATKGRRALSST